LGSNSHPAKIVLGMSRVYCDLFIYSLNRNSKHFDLPLILQANFPLKLDVDISMQSTKNVDGTDVAFSMIYIERIPGAPLANHTLQ